VGARKEGWRVSDYNRRRRKKKRKRRGKRGSEWTVV